jgi:hypothetical protein
LRYVCVVFVAAPLIARERLILSSVVTIVWPDCTDIIPFHLSHVTHVNTREKLTSELQQLASLQPSPTEIFRTMARRNAAVNPIHDPNYSQAAAVSPVPGWLASLGTQAMDPCYTQQTI